MDNKTKVKILIVYMFKLLYDSGTVNLNWAKLYEISESLCATYEELIEEVLYEDENYIESVFLSSVKYIFNLTDKRALDSMSEQLNTIMSESGRIYKVKEYKVLDNVTSIEPYAFKENDILEKITLNNKIDIIQYNTFDSCIKLKSIIVPKNVTGIGQLAFRNCISLEEITIENDDTKIGDNAFEGCSKLKTINACDRIKNIINSQIN